MNSDPRVNVEKLKRRLEEHDQLRQDDRTGTPASSSSQGIGFAAERRGSIFRGENEYLDRGQTGSWKRRRGSPRNRQWDLHAAVLNQRSSESERECAHFIQMLDIDIREHLVELFWTFYNPISQLTRRQLFIDALEYGSSDFYSPHLHLAILAIGLRYADTSRHLRRLLPDGRESLLHRELKQRLENLPMESVRVPHLQAMLLLADLEYACGRETTSRTYLHRVAQKIHDPTTNSSSAHMNVAVGDGDWIAQRMLLRSCTFLSAHWTMLDWSSNPDKGIKASNHLALPVYRKLHQKSALMKDSESRIYAAHLELLDLTDKMLKFLAPFVDTEHPDLLLMLDTAHNELGRCHVELDKPLQWTKENMQGASPGYFLLHQQYQAAVIALYRPFVVVPPGVLTMQRYSSTQTTLDQVSPHARKVSLGAATRLALMVGEYAGRFSLKHVFTTVVSQCSLAADVLVMHLNLQPERKELVQIVDGLKLLYAVFHAQSNVFEPAERVVKALEEILGQLGALPAEESTPGGRDGCNSSTGADGTENRLGGRPGPRAGEGDGQWGDREVDFSADCVFSPFKDEMIHILKAVKSIDSVNGQSEHAAPDAGRQLHAQMLHQDTSTQGATGVDVSRSASASRLTDGLGEFLFSGNSGFSPVAGT